MKRPKILGLALFLSLLSPPARASELAVLSQAARGESAAKAAGAQAVSSIPARLEYLRLGYHADFSNVAICVQGSSVLNGSELLLDVKLAYAAWLDASGLGDAETWSRLSFVPKAHCEGREFSGIVVVGEDGVASAATAEQRFLKASAHCTKSESEARCVGTPMTLGFGGPGGLTFESTVPGKWENIRNLTPAILLLNPHVSWTSLATDLPTVAPGLVQAYEELRTRADRVEYRELAAFNGELKAQRVILRRTDRGITRLTQGFLKSKNTEIRQDYRPEHSAFHVLLHEVGHQFGMDHLEASGVMANTAEYAYLTFDDTLNAQTLARRARGAAEHHKTW